MSRVRKTKSIKIKIIQIVCLLIFFFLVAFSTTHAQEISDMVVSVSVAPHYKVVAQNDKLVISTNMILYVNGKRVAY